MPHQPPIPPLVHFIFGLSDDPALREFTFQHYVAVHAAHELLRPAVLWLHHHYVPTGEWWARARPLLVLKPTDAHAEVFGRPLAQGWGSFPACRSSPWCSLVQTAVQKSVSRRDKNLRC